MNAQEGQKTYPQQEPMKPGMSEYWTPQPKVVTPGDIKTNSAPSDAIVLFDGKDLSAWESAKGGPAEWNVHVSLKIARDEYSWLSFVKMRL